MAKVTIQHVTDAGFRAEQFGTPADFVTASTGYVARVIDDAEVWARDIVGTVKYDAATSGAPLLRLKNAELCYVKAVLWRRRMSWLDSNAQSSLDGSSQEYLNRREYEAHAAAADACAAHWMQQFLEDGPAILDAGVRAGHVASGPYPPLPECLP